MAQSLEARGKLVEPSAQGALPATRMSVLCLGSTTIAMRNAILCGDAVDCLDHVGTKITHTPVRFIMLHHCAVTVGSATTICTNEFPH
jgi:hypothetical protein